MKKTVGILALQGSFAEHAAVLRELGVNVQLVRSKEALEPLTHLIIPGGESTTMVKLLKDNDMQIVLQTKVKDGSLRVMGTCAGAILCQYLGMDIECERNGYGAQQASFSAQLTSKQFPDLRGIFIRAPRLRTPSGSSFQEGGEKEVKVLATLDDEPVLVEQGSFLALAFHPELVGERRVHEYFLEK